jgi:alpha,alpha-trehalase
MGLPERLAPHQMIAWVGLKNYGLKEPAQRLIYKWLFMITKNAADYNGTVPEKFDVLKMSHEVFAEYGNVGTDFAYITREGFGWMNASYQVGLAELNPELRKQLENLVPPERLH